MSSLRLPGNQQLHMTAESPHEGIPDEGALSAATTVTNHSSTVTAHNRSNAVNQFVDSLDKCLFMSTTTWARDSHELFDYEARHVHKKCCELKRAAKIFRTTLDVQVVLDGQPLPTQSADFLLSIRERDGKFSVLPADRNVPLPLGCATTLMPKKLWLIVKELPTGNHQLQESDVIKLGRFKLRVKQLVKTGATLPELRLDDVETPHSVVTPEEASTMQCRICLLEGGTTEDPLLCPCQCKGSIKFVHLDCLRRWINGRLSISLGDDQQRASFFFKQLHCELCKAVFPSAVFLNSERVPIVRVPKIEPPFIILENIVGAANRGLHVVSMNAKKELKLGRGHESDVRIADVSISRYHATIRFSDGEFILEDHHSKFGTLVSLRKLQMVEESHPLAVQVGRTVVNLSIRKPSCHFEDLNDVNEDLLGQTPRTDPEDDGASHDNHHAPPPSGDNNNSNNRVRYNPMDHLVAGGQQHPTTRSIGSEPHCSNGAASYYQRMRIPGAPFYNTVRLQNWSGACSISPQIHHHGMRTLPSLINSLPESEQVPSELENLYDNIDRRSLQQSTRRERSNSSDYSDNEASSAGPLLQQLIAYRTEVDSTNNQQQPSLMTDSDGNNDSGFNLRVSPGVDFAIK